MLWSDRFSRRTLVRNSATALTAAAVAPVFAQSSAAGSANPRLGINLSRLVDGNTEQAFTNVFRQSRPWVSQREDADWGSGPPLDLDEFGWVRRLEPGCYAETLMMMIRGGHYPGGRYVVTYEGRGELDFYANVTVESREPGRVVLNVDSSRNGFRAVIRSTEPDDYIRNIRVMMPGFESGEGEQLFRPSFLERWRGAECLRFMDWMATSDSEVERWSQRTTEQHGTFARRGAPLEVLISLANELQADPWFCMPHKADDDFVRNFAAMVRDRLDPGLKAWVEYSNELWNTVYDHYDYAHRRGAELDLGTNPRRIVARFAAHRSRQMFSIWEDVFGSTERFVRVLSSQAATRDFSEEILRFRDAYEDADVLAIAPYMALNVHDSRGRVLTDEFEQWSVDEALDYLEQFSLARSIEWMGMQKEIADRYGLKLVAYEAGQHMVAVGNANRNDTVNETMHAANVHPRMGEIYEKYYNAWEQVGGDLICHFTSAARPTAFGSWGMIRHGDDTAADSPKYAASIRWARSRGQMMNLL